MIGDVVVVGLVTGTHMIEDIKIAVPHKVAVHIPADLALQSKDLWRALQQGSIFKLDGGSGLRSNPAPTSAATASRVSQLENLNAQLTADNARLQRELLDLTAKYEGLQQAFQALDVVSRMDQIQGMLSKLEGLPATLQGMTVQGPAGSVMVARTQASDVVGGEVPRFIPEVITPKGVKSQIDVQSETSEGAGVTDAASRLRAIRQKNR